MGDTKKVMFKDVYYDESRPGSYGGVEALARVNKQTKKKKIEDWLGSQDTYTIHKPIKKKFHRRGVISGGINHQFQADLVDLQKIKKENKKTTFLLTCIDVFSKYAYVIPLKDKTGKSIVSAFKQIFKTLEEPPYLLQTDSGPEFLNVTFQKYLKKSGVKHFVTYNNDTKSSIIEIFNRTLKRRMFRYFTKHNTKRYIDILPSLVKSYNNTYHHSIKLTPNQVNNDNEEKVWQRLYGNPSEKKRERKKYPLGSRVRISKVKGLFEKGYLPNWTDELFTISKVLHRTNPVTYEVKDDAGEVLRGTFYHEELQKVSDKEVYRIANIVKTRTVRGDKQYLVQWYGYPRSFDSWISSKNVELYKQ